MLPLSRSEKSAFAATILLLLLLILPAVYRYHHRGILNADCDDSKWQSCNSFASRRPYRPGHVEYEASDAASLASNQSILRSQDADPPVVNTLVVYAGRWKFIRVLFPYVYRELRKNGGVLDRVWFMMVNYDRETHSNLVRVTQVANGILNQDVFELHFMGYPQGKLPPQKNRYTTPYYEMFAEMITNSSNTFFKIDDDIVYIHPGTFKNMVKSKNSQLCFLHSANIVTNWRCNIKHQDLGVYKTSEEVNPKNLTFEFDPNGNCGWKSPECAELTLRTFLYYYHQGQLDKYQFEGLELLYRRKRFSINFFLLDKDMINIKSMLEVGPIRSDDEKWWSQTYAGKFKQPNCIVGSGLVVHFSYFTTAEKMLQLGLLAEFEVIVQKEVGTRMEKELWKILEFDSY